MSKLILPLLSVNRVPSINSMFGGSNTTSINKATWKTHVGNVRTSSISNSSKTFEELASEAIYDEGTENETFSLKPTMNEEMAKVRIR